MAKLIKAGLFGLLIGIVGVVLSVVPLSRSIEEDVGLGLLFQLRGVRSPPTDVVVIRIDHDSSAYFNVPNNPDEWPRSLYARLTERLAQAGARVIIFDVNFLEARSPEEDGYFEKAIQRAGNVVLAETLIAGDVPAGMIVEARDDADTIVEISKPFSAFKKAAAGTGPFVLSSMPAKVYQDWMFQQGAGEAPIFPILALQLFFSPVYQPFIELLEQVRPNVTGQLPKDFESARRSKGLVELVRDIRKLFQSDPRLTEDMLRALSYVGPRPTKAKNFKQLRALIKVYGSAQSRYLNFYGPSRTITTIPYYQVLDSRPDATRDARTDLKGKVVFVGRTDILPGVRKDRFYPMFFQGNGVYIGGVEISATVFANMLEDSSVTPMSLRAKVLFLLSWGLLVGVVCRMLSTVMAAGAVLGLSLLYLVGAAYAFQDAFTWSPLVIPLLVQGPLAFGSAVSWNSYQIDKERKNMRKVFGDHLPNDVVDALSHDLADLKGGPRVVYGTCLFTEAANYTTLSEKVNPQELRVLLGKYFNALFTPVRHHGGLIVDLRGNSTLAIWKANQDQLGLRKQACFAALDIAKSIDRFNQEVRPYSLPTRIGLHSGQFTIGMERAVDYAEYRPAGEIVNMACRVKGCNKYMGTTIAVTGDVVHGLEAPFLFRELGQFKLKGHEPPFVLHELISRLEEADQNQMIVSRIFAKGLGAFRTQDWNVARDLFSQCLNHIEGDGPSEFYLQLCEQYSKNPPPEPWDKVVTIENYDPDLFSDVLQANVHDSSGSNRWPGSRNSFDKHGI
ncbi:CHASE2 domain-containing protein [Candidatus Nitrospira allomarina]|uniref:Adenylate/guanylate cyclase domain-containing protein n=1 Tax=Candidatus Nitrospira allomarina TaxID=3020900 RepID=A0AA96JSI4_9BACT|nr:adenylate/guanylate cyclase domain-containing protein [Candidatus Nitrospira allomarina]WNM58602.1 adenylate/guanylate cyclase domain-containing protein [Candidatus Nitrospira allomarina]